MSTLVQLQSLVAVHRHGSVTAAAEALGLSQPAVTRSLQELQAEVGQVLLSRQGRRLELTETGRIVLEHAESLVNQDARAGKELAAWLKSRHAEIRLAASAVPIATILPGAIELVRSTHAQARIRIVESTYPDVIRLFRENAIDLAVGSFPAGLRRAGYRVESLFSVAMRVALPRGHRLRNRRRLADLRALPWVVSGSLEASTELFQNAFVQCGLEPPRSVLHCESTASSLQFIEQSRELAGFIAHPLASEAEQAGRISLPPIADPLPGHAVGIFHPSHLSQTTVSMALFSALRLAARRYARQLGHATE